MHPYPPTRIAFPLGAFSTYTRSSTEARSLFMFLAAPAAAVSGVSGAPYRFCNSAGAVYHSNRSKGVQVLWSREVDRRSDRGTSATTSAGEKVYMEAVARVRLTDAKQIAAEIFATL